MGDKDSNLPVDAPDPAALSALLVGYDVQELVACGGMGAVYRGRQVSLDREVAIKVLPRELAEDAEFSASFAAEARAMAKLAHPNLISVFDFGEVEGMFYLVMEFVEGDTLYAACHDQLVDAQQAVEIVRAVSAGLGVAHEEGIIHRDIKPANVFIGQDLVPKLGDFGLAVPSDDVASGLAMGTPGFVAPEVMADSEAASAASDVFALGAMLHQMLSGITPDGETVPDLALVPLAHGLRTLVQKALSDQPAMRFQNGEEMAEALGEWLEKAKRGLAQTGGSQWGSPVAISGQTPAYAAESSGGGGGRLAVMMLVLVGMIGGGAWYVMGKGDDSNEEPDGLPPVVSLMPEKKPEKEDDVETPDKKPEVSPQVPEKTLSEEEIKEKYMAALKDARAEMIENRIANLAELQAEVEGQGQWESYLKLVDAQTRFLPEYLTGSDESALGSADVGLLRKYVIERQGDNDEEFVSKVRELHVDCLRELRGAKVEVKTWVNNYWEGWVESLGMSPLYLAGTNLAGDWERVDSNGEGVTMRIDNRHGATIIRNGIEVTGEKMLRVFDDGRIIIVPNPEEPEEKWILRLRGWDLIGREKDGPECEFSWKRSDLVSIVNGGSDGSGGGAARVPGKAPGGHRLTDPVLLELNGKYLAAVERQVGPIMVGYRKVVEDGLALATRRNDVRGVERIGVELVRLDSLGWKEGCVIFDEIDWESDVPLSLKGKKAKFDRDFKEKMGKLQNYYISQLEKKLLEYRPAGKDLGEIQRELDRFSAPEGMVQARYVKLQAEKADGVSHAVVNELNILGRDGEPLLQGGMEIHSVSSAQIQEEDAQDRSAKFAIDGDPHTLWHSRWREPSAEWPHWIAIDLQSEQLITGFRVLPRQNWQRIGDVVSWTLFVSLDGNEWREVARGEFPKSKEEQEFVFGN